MLKTPKPMSDAIRRDDGGEGSPVDSTPHKTRRAVTVRLPQGLIDEMEAFCEDKYMSKTNLIINAVVDYIRSYDSPK